MSKIRSDHDTETNTTKDYYSDGTLKIYVGGKLIHEVKNNHKVAVDKTTIHQ
tara:strand:- start:70 stop:225 length:156 start_codon:yes stop_codon:yes gene_type:complete